MSKRYETLQIPSMCYLGLPCKNSSGDYSPKARLPPLPFMEKPHTHAFRSEIESRPRACRNATKLLGHSQCVIWEVHAKIHREIIPLRRVCLRSRRKNRTGARHAKSRNISRDRPNGMKLGMPSQFGGRLMHEKFQTGTHSVARRLFASAP